VDITFGDFLRALVTADYELAPLDEHGQRQAMIEAFRVRGIYPDHVSSLSEESVLYETARLERLSNKLVGHLALAEYVYSEASMPAGGSEPELPEAGGEEFSNSVAKELRDYVKRNAAALGFDASRAGKIQILGFHPAFRVNSHGGLVMELVAQFTQSAEPGGTDLGGMEPRAGTTLIAAADGTVRYMVAKPLPGKGVSEAFREGFQARFDRQQAFVAESDLADAHLPWAGVAYLKSRMSQLKLASLHLGLQS
jgi:hypothetical protein